VRLSGSKAPSRPRRALREHNAALPDHHLPPHARALAAQIYAPGDRMRVRTAANRVRLVPPSVFSITPQGR
jgi:hypothetical protein